MTYLELSDFLQIQASTMRNIWREFPHFYVTEASRKAGCLKGARFCKDDVLRYLKEKTELEYGHTRDSQVKRHGVPSVFQISRPPVLKNLLQSEGGKGLGTRRQKGPQSTTGYATEFDVFPC